MIANLNLEYRLFLVELQVEPEKYNSPSVTFLSWELINYVIILEVSNNKL